MTATTPRLTIEYDTFIAKGNCVSDASCRKTLARYGVTVKGLGEKTGGAYHKNVRLTGKEPRTLAQWVALIRGATGSATTLETLSAALTNGARVYTESNAEGVCGAQTQNRDCLNSIGTARRVSCRSISPVSKVRVGAV